MVGFCEHCDERTGAIKDAELLNQPPCLLRKQMVHCRLHDGPTVRPILSQLNPIHICALFPLDNVTLFRNITNPPTERRDQEVTTHSYCEGIGFKPRPGDQLS
jgi:hypothetical protein